jgi:hypothetical protein
LRVRLSRRDFQTLIGLLKLLRDRLASASIFLRSYLACDMSFAIIDSGGTKQHRLLAVFVSSAGSFEVGLPKWEWGNVFLLTRGLFGCAMCHS